MADGLVGVTAVAPGHGEQVLRKPAAAGSVTLTGRPGDLLLYLTGRTSAADVAVEGSPEADRVFRTTSLGL